MKELTIEISIDGNGELNAETFGFKGKVCEDELIDLFKDEFVIEEVEKKDDYFKPAEHETLTKNSQRSTKK